MKKQFVTICFLYLSLFLRDLVISSPIPKSK